MEKLIGTDFLKGNLTICSKKQNEKNKQLKNVPEILLPGVFF